MSKKKVITTVTTTTTTEEVMDKKVETHYLLIMDESGSMSSVRETTIKTFNEQVQAIKSLEKDFPDQKYFMSLITFNSNVSERFMNIPANELKEITSKDYNPEGMTALLDAMGRGISRLEDKLRPEMNKSDKTVTAVVVIVTDGEENASVEWKGNGKIKNLIERLNKDERWTISYVGANQDAILNGSNFGINIGNTVNYTATVNGTASVGNALTHTLYSRARGISQAGVTADASLSFFSGAGYDKNIDENLIVPPSNTSINLDDVDVLNNKK